MNACITERIPFIHNPFTSDTRLNGLSDSHGISNETLFNTQINIEYVNALGFVGKILTNPVYSTPQR
jgi:hypothetical protein